MYMQEHLAGIYCAGAQRAPLLELPGRKDCLVERPEPGPTVLLRALLMLPLSPASDCAAPEALREQLLHIVIDFKLHLSSRNGVGRPARSSPLPSVST